MAHPESFPKARPHWKLPSRSVRAWRPRRWRQSKATGWLISRPSWKRTGPFNSSCRRLPKALEIFRHSSAHLLAAAVTDLFPDAHPGIGPPTETGFYYDFYREKPFTEEDLAKIEAKMQELVQANLPNERVYFPKEEGLKVFEQMGEFLKCQLIQEKADPVFSAYRTGKFLDFCRGPHIPSTGRIKAFKLLERGGSSLER